MQHNVDGTDQQRGTVTRVMDCYSGDVVIMPKPPLNRQCCTSMPLLKTSKHRKAIRTRRIKAPNEKRSEYRLDKELLSAAEYRTSSALASISQTQRAHCSQPPRTYHALETGLHLYSPGGMDPAVRNTLAELGRIVCKLKLPIIWVVVIIFIQLTHNIACFH